MRCPTCPETDMFVLEFERIEVDYCPGCQGVWLDSGELAILGVKAGALQKAFLAAVEGKTDAKPVPTGRKCPVCGETMAEFDIPGEPPISIDRCTRGHGLWFDRGELQNLIARAHSAEDNTLARFLADLEGSEPKEA